MKKNELSKKTLVELRAMAKSLGFSGYSRLRKGELIEELLGTRVSPERSATRAEETPGSGPKRGPTNAERKPRSGAGSESAGDASPDASARARAGKKRAEMPDAPPSDELLLSPRTKRAFASARKFSTKTAQARRLAEQRIKASKYYLGVEESPELDEGFEYPETYGETTIVLMVRDPYWLYAYWELAPGIETELAGRIGRETLRKSRVVLRVYDVTAGDPDHAVSHHDIDVAPGTRNWYINVMRVERDYCVDLGVITPDGEFVVVARSNRVSLPPVGPSDVIDEEWVTVEALADLYEPPGGGPTSGSGGWGAGGAGR